MREAILDVRVEAAEPQAFQVVERSDYHRPPDHREDLIFSTWWLAFSILWDRTIEVSLLKRAIEDAGHGARMVDVGCGDMTLFARGFLNLPAHYLGVEPNQRLLTKAKRQFPNASLISSGGTSLHVGSDQADLVLCLWVLHISDEIPSLLKECGRIGRRGSKLIITIPDLNSELYSEVHRLTGRMFPESQISSPNAVLGEQHGLLFNELAGCDYKITRFSGSVSLPREPANRIMPLIDFAQWLLPSGLQLNPLLQRACAHVDDFADLPSVLQDKGLLIEATLP